MSRRFRLPAALGMVVAATGLLVLSGLAHLRLPDLGPSFWSADLAGWLGYFAILLLCAVPVRHRLIPHPAPMVLRVHRALGWIATATIAAHVALSLVDMETLDYWLPSAPLYMLAGLVALPIAFGACILAEHAVRRRVYRQHSRFRRDHHLLSLALVVLAFAHAAGSGAIASTPWRLLPWLVLSIAALLLPLRRPLRDVPP